MHDASPPLSQKPSTQPEPGPFGPQQVIPAIIAQLQSAVHTLKMASHVQSVTRTRFGAGQLNLRIQRSRSFVETLAGTSINRCLMLLLSQMGGR